MAEETDPEYYENLVDNRIWVCPMQLIACVGYGIIVKQTDQYGFTKTKSGLIIPTNSKWEKKYNMCEVLAIGENVPRDSVDIGDIVLIQRSTAFRLPNGIAPAAMWRVQYDTMHVIVTLPNLVEARLSAKFRPDGARANIVKEDQYIVASEHYKTGAQTNPWDSRDQTA